jgi:hypothetical protein
LKCPSGTTCGSYGECVPAPSPVGGPFVRRRVLAVDTTYFTRPNAGHRQTTEAIVFKGVFPYQNATFEPEVPLVYDASLDANTALLAGNPTFSVKGRWLLRRLDLYAGGGMSLPIASTEGDDIEHFPPLFLATASQGFWNNWWYATDKVPLFAPFGARYVWGSGLEVGVDAAVAFLFPTTNGVDHYPLVLLQAGVTAGLSFSDFETGIRLRGVRIPQDETPDLYEASVEPFGRISFGDVFAGAGFLMNLGEYPIGVLVRDSRRGLLWNRDGIWGARLEAGVKF